MSQHVWMSEPAACHMHHMPAAVCNGCCCRLRMPMAHPFPPPLPPTPFTGGDDFKSGQTKMKSVLVDFLVGAGIKPTSIVSYNHLGNNDGMNLSAPQVRVVGAGGAGAAGQQMGGGATTPGVGTCRLTGSCLGARRPQPRHP